MLSADAQKDRGCSLAWLAVGRVARAGAERGDRGCRRRGQLRQVERAMDSASFLSVLSPPQLGFAPEAGWRCIAAESRSVMIFSSAQ